MKPSILLAFWLLLLHAELLFGCKSVLRTWFRHFNWDPFPGERLGPLLPLSVISLPPVQRDQPNNVPHIHHMVLSALLLPSHGWYWIYVIHRSFFRCVPPQIAAKATQICTFFCPSWPCTWWTCGCKAICENQGMETAQGVHRGLAQTLLPVSAL